MNHSGILLYECNTCGKTGSSMSFCSGCIRIRYCSIECQRKNWLDHKETCKSHIDVRNELRQVIILSQKYHLDLIPLTIYGSVISIKECAHGIKVVYSALGLNEECRLIIFNKDNDTYLQLYLSIKDNKRLSYDATNEDLSPEDMGFISLQMNNADVIMKCTLSLNNDILISWTIIGGIYFSNMNRSANQHIEFFSVVFKDRSDMIDYLSELVDSIQGKDIVFDLHNQDTHKKRSISGSTEEVVNVMLSIV